MSDTVCVIILNWNGARDTLRCARAVAASDHPTSIIIVDNGSTDDSLDVLAQSSQPFELVRLDRNLGFAGGMNAGVRVALRRGARHVWLLNSDAVPAPDALSQMLAHVDRYAVCTSLQVTSTAPWSADDQPYVTGWRLPGGKMKPVHCGGCATGRHDVDVVTGASLLVGAEWFDRVGLLDESFFHYKEEYDLVVRIADAGGRVGLVCASRVWHQCGASLGQATPRARYYHYRNELLYMRKRYGRPLVRVVTREPIHIKTFAESLVHCLLPARRPVARAIIAGYLDGLRGVTGPTGRF